VPWLVAVPIGLTSAAAVGVLVDVAVVQRLRRAPRLIVVVATIGVADALTGGAQLLGSVGRNRSLAAFGVPVHARLSVFPAVFGADDLFAIVAAAAVLGGVVVLVRRSDVGIALRAVADNSERAQLSGVPIRLVSSLTWAAAASLSALAIVLQVPVQHLSGADQIAVGGLPLLLRGLAAAVIAGMDRLPRAVVAAVAIGVFDAAATWTTTRTTFVDASLLVVVLATLLAQRDRFSRVPRVTGPEWRALGVVRPIPAAIANLPKVRWSRRVAVATVVLSAAALPLWAGPSLERGAGLLVVYGIAALSLVPLLGWAGQISLGQFALVGFGGATTAVLYERHGWDLFLALPTGMAVATCFALVIGLPALRVRGPYLAVATLAFAVTSSAYLLDGRFFPWLVQDRLDRPVLWGRLPLREDWQVYELCLAGLVVTLVALANIRRTRTGRALVAVRDNPAAAEASGLSSIRLTLTAFAVSGVVAGFAGGLYVVQQQGFHTDAFRPEVSIRLFAMVVVGGLGSLSGALLGVLYVRGTDLLLPDAWAALASGLGILVLILLFPEGLGGLSIRGRDAVVRVIARHHVDDASEVTEDPDTIEGSPLEAVPATVSVGADA
jgi:branched-chain amino acid transport system permease protein